MKDKIFRLTPLGRADIELKNYLSADEDIESSEEFKSYEKALKKYRNLKILQMSVKVLLYAGLITSIAASVGLEQISILNQIASYIGVTFLLLGYAVTNYATMLHREEYHVRREILVSHFEVKIENSENDDDIS